MAEYIEKTQLLEKLKHRVSTDDDSKFATGFIKGTNEALGIIEEWIASIPAADVAPVVHGKWKATGTFKVADYNYTVVEQRCSACGHCSIRFKNKAESNYCPKCGAKIDEEEHDNNV